MQLLSKINGQKRNLWLTYGMVILAFVIMQTMIATGSISRLLLGLLIPLCVYVILAVSLNFTVGIMGELSIGHAGFMCVGAFSGAFFSVVVQDSGMSPTLRFLLALVIGAIMAGIFGFLIGIPVLRLHGGYLALVTLAFGEIIKNIVNIIFIGRDSTGLHFTIIDSRSMELGADGEMLINGPLGILGIPRDSTFIIGFILVLITIFIITNMMNSRAGRAIMAIRDNRIAAESIGINVTKYKLLAFTISASLAGVAGVLFAHNFSTLAATSQNFGYNMSIMILVFVVLGGMGNIRGSIIAAVVLTVLPEMLRGLADFRMLMYSVLLILMMILNWAPRAIEFRERYGLKAFLQKRKNAKEGN